MTYYDITPLAKPRMTRADKWKQRPEVLRYRAFKDECRLKKVTLAYTFRVTFYIEMPKSWSAKKRASHNLQPCQQKPDVDNLIKGLMDAVLEDDAHVWYVEAAKLWAVKPGILIELPASPPSICILE